MLWGRYHGERDTLGLVIAWGGTGGDAWPELGREIPWDWDILGKEIHRGERYTREGDTLEREVPWKGD